MPAVLLERETFETSRAAEYFSIQELQTQTGQPVHRFPDVVLKELVDNALDAAESAGVAPVVTLYVEHDQETETVVLAVRDNGPGLPTETVEKILNFQTRTSDKAAYRSATRGAQGNALKTVLGIPHALGCAAPVVIEAQGVRHTIRAWIDPAQELRIEHDRAASDVSSGTTIAVPLRVEPGGGPPDAVRWGHDFALFNPHAAVRIRTATTGGEHAHDGPGTGEKTYQPTVAFPGAWRKFLPTDLTSAWWYDLADLERLVFAHIALARRGGRSKLLRDFVREFRGLSANAKAKAVCAALPGVTRLADLEAVDDGVPRLHTAMRDHSTAPSADVLGALGEAHLRARLDEAYGVKDGRWWYKRAAGSELSLPFVVEVAVAETQRPGGVISGVNFSPTYDDPLANTSLHGGDVYGYGVRGFAQAAHVVADRWGPPRSAVVVFHLSLPRYEVLDRAKTRVVVPPAVREAAGEALWACCKALYREAEQQKKDAAKAEKAQQAREREQAWSLKEAVFAVLREALRRATGGGALPVSARTLYYAVRPLVQQYTTKPLAYDYFSQTLLTAYREDHGDIPGLYYDPRGVLYEPHGGREVPLGTREVSGYEFPSWLYDKILYVEKKGLWPTLREARLAERYDLAVVAAEGYANEAARVLFARAQRGQRYRIFVLHDADPYGYNIARTLREATRRMPEHNITVADLGLRVADAQRMGLEEETFTRQQALPAGLDLDETERRYFIGQQRGPTSWICRRVELNAMSGPQLVGYIQAGLEAAGATDKVIPPDDVLESTAAAVLRSALATRIGVAIDLLLRTPQLVDRLAQAWGADPLREPRERVVEGFEEDRGRPWRAIVEAAAEALAAARVSAGAGELERAVREHVTGALRHGARGAAAGEEEGAG